MSHRKKINMDIRNHPFTYTYPTIHGYRAFCCATSPSNVSVIRRTSCISSSAGFYCTTSHFQPHSAAPAQAIVQAFSPTLALSLALESTLSWLFVAWHLVPQMHGQDAFVSMVERMVQPYTSQPGLRYDADDATDQRLVAMWKSPHRYLLFADFM